MFMHILIKQSINVNLYNIEINHFFNPKNLITFLKFFSRINIYFEKKKNFKSRKFHPSKILQPNSFFSLENSSTNEKPFCVQPINM